MSVLLAITITGLLFIIGVVHDVGGQIRTALYAEQVAAEAARAAGQALTPMSWPPSVSTTPTR